MGDLIDLDRFRQKQPFALITDDTIDTSAIASAPQQPEPTVSHDELAVWLSGFATEFERQMVGADLLYICLNRTLVETALSGVAAICEVLPQCAKVAIVTEVMARERSAVRDTPMRDLVADILHSNRALWLEDADKYGAISFEFRRRIDIYNGFIDSLA